MQFIESTIDLLSPVIEFNDINDQQIPECYPLPELRSTASTRMTTFRTLTVENDFTRIVVCPDLGGRIIEFTDRVSGTNVLPPILGVEPSVDDYRGLWWRAGIQWFAGMGRRANSMAPTLTQFVEGESGGSLVMFDLDPCTGLSTHISLSLADDEPGVRLAGRVFNRTFFAQPGACGLWIPCDGRCVSTSDFGGVVFSPSQGSGIAVVADPGLIESWTELDSAVRLDLLGAGDAERIGPRQSFEFEFSLYPVAGVEGRVVLGQGVLLSVGASVAVQALGCAATGKVEITARSGERFSAPIQIDPQKPFCAGLAGYLSDPQMIEVLASDGEQLAVWPRSDARTSALTFDPPRESARQAEFRSLAATVGTAKIDEPKLVRAAKDRQLTAPVELVRAYQLLADQRWSEAAERLEAALALHESDPLAWWLLALCRRKLGESSEQSEELLAAHYFAPLDPVLRAESFLAQPMTMGSQPHGTVSPIAAFADMLVDVACNLIEAGLFGEAMRWIDECLRHEPVRALHHLGAYCLAHSTEMAVEAASHLAAAQRCQNPFPLPHRNIHRHAIRELNRRFPADTLLQNLAAVISGEEAAHA